MEYGEENTKGLADFYNPINERICEERRNFKYEVMCNINLDDDWRKSLIIAAK